jgi:hypothetical protein
LDRTTTRLVEVLDKTITLAQSKGPLEFQAVQAMTMQYPVQETQYDPSDEAEARRLGEYKPAVEDVLNGYERDAADDSFLNDLKVLDER